MSVDAAWSIVQFESSGHTQEMSKSELSEYGYDCRGTERISGQVALENAVVNSCMKTEPDQHNISDTTELHFLRVRVKELEREKAEMAAENQRLKDLLVNEIPSLLSHMKQTLSANFQQTNHHHPESTLPTSESMGENESYRPVEWMDQSLHLPQTVSAVRQDKHDEAHEHSADFGLNMSVSLNGVDVSDFEQGYEIGMEQDTNLLTEEEQQHKYATSSGDFSYSAQPKGHTLRSQHSGIDKANLHIQRQVEVYPGSGVFCEERTWQIANQSRSPTAMVRVLLLGVFDRDTLLNSNLRGGRSRRPSYHNHHAPLDPHKINAIYNATLARFPLARKGQIGIGINSKLSEIRFHSRKVKRDPRHR